MNNIDDLFCVLRLGRDEGLEVINLIERVTGQPCPCKQGMTCPVAPQVSLDLGMPKQRSA